MGDVVLSLRGIVREYDSGAYLLRVLRGVDLDLRAGEMVGLVGPSGSGKSSLLHAAGLLERPTAGEVVVAGRKALELDDAERTMLRRRYMGFVYQFHHLLPELSARDNVILPQLIAGRPRSEARKNAERLLDHMGLADRLNHQPAELSGGEQQRVAIARALANGPRLILADEPTGNLDPTTSATVFGQLKDLVRNESIAAMVATHNLDLVSHMDRVVTLRDGRLEPYVPGAVTPRATGEGASEARIPRPKIKVRPWARWLAKSVDGTLFALAAGALMMAATPLVGVAFSSNAQFAFERSGWPIVIATALALLGGVVAEAILIAAFGSTPGKALLGIRLERYNGKRLRLGRSLSRSIQAFIFGQGLALGLISVGTMISSALYLLDQRTTSWDRRCDVRYITKSVGPLRWLLALVIVFGVSGAAVWQLLGQPSLF